MLFMWTPPRIVDGIPASYVPPDFASSTDLYPNPLNITKEEQRSFHPVVKFPGIYNDDGQWKRAENYRVLDLRNAPPSGLASHEEWRQRPPRPNPHKGFSVGRYDENRVSLYTASNLFGEARTVHMGIDLFGPVDTEVFAFVDGIVHSAGYNPKWGDYGHVIVVEHDLGGTTKDGRRRKLWALYGHLDQKSTRNIHVGQHIRRGTLLGRMGNIHENGGWWAPHVHFQLSLYPPKTHDMPGVVSPADRPHALLHYPDPRLVLGPLY